MANIQNNTVVQKVVDAFDLQVGVDQIPNASSNFIQPTYELNTPTINILRDGNRTTSGSLTVYTTPSDKDFYLTYYAFNCMSNATCDNTDIYIACYIDGALRNIFFKKKQSLTSDNFTVTVPIQGKGIKIDRGTVIACGTTFTAGAASFALTIGGYLE